MKKKLWVIIILAMGVIASSEPTETNEFMVREWLPLSCGAPGGPCYGGVPPELI